MPVENLDSFFIIARQHMVCEDYAVASLHPNPHLIMCDGCSTSPNTDIGARILAMSAQRFLKEHFKISAQTCLSYYELGYGTINTAKQIIELLELDISCLDATLMIAVPFRDVLQVYVYGDGYVTAVNASDELVYTNIAYEQNMPYYLSYWIDEERKSLYLLYNRGGEKVVTLTKCYNDQKHVQVLDYNAPLTFTFPGDTYSLAALMSDGVASFLSLEDNQKIPVNEVLKQLVAYKTTKGDFVKRRTKRMLKNYSRQNIYPTDDVSVAAILFH